MQFHGGVYRSDDAGKTGSTSAKGSPSDFGFPVVVDPADPDSAYVIPLVGAEDRDDAAGGRPRLGDEGCRATWVPRGTGCRAETRI